jgi:hypothetical protein
LVSKFWQILTRNLAKLVKFTPRKEKKKIPISGSKYGKILPLKKIIGVNPKNYICQASNIKL